MEKEKHSPQDNPGPESETPKALEDLLLGSVLARRPRGEKIPRKPSQRVIIVPDGLAPSPASPSLRAGSAPSPARGRGKRHSG